MSKLTTFLSHSLTPSLFCLLHVVSDFLSRSGFNRRRHPSSPTRTFLSFGCTDRQTDRLTDREREREREREPMKRGKGRGRVLLALLVALKTQRNSTGRLMHAFSSGSSCMLIHAIAYRIASGQVDRS
mmetsp:Transcript_52623/g.102920  ORF Transcript_52623/g.102920 Transcript_52623/m.102920 type:complete len:128 (+) Transcript_52623:102-485(+)